MQEDQMIDVSPEENMLEDQISNESNESGDQYDEDQHQFSDDIHEYPRNLWQNDFLDRMNEIFNEYTRNLQQNAVFEHVYHCFSISSLNRPIFENGDKIIKHASALDRLLRMNIEYPMLFELKNSSADRTNRCGVLEFTTDEWVVSLPNWVVSWGAYLLSRDILTMSFALRDTHERQAQFALERGVLALIGILASIRLPYPSRAFDMAHCSRCLIPWGQHDGIYLTEVDRVLHPGGYWILSGPLINWERHWKGWERTKESLNDEQDSIENVAKSLCWKKLVQKGDFAIWQNSTNYMHCKIKRKIFKTRPFCDKAQNPDMAW